MKTYFFSLLSLKLKKFKYKIIRIHALKEAKLALRGKKCIINLSIKHKKNNKKIENAENFL